MSQEDFKTIIVWLILSNKTQEALELLAKHYQVDVPLLKVGLPKKHKIRAYGCYTVKNQTIFVQNSDQLANPFVIIHEFYHHLRTKAVDKKHRGTEKGADLFAKSFINEYQNTVKRSRLNQ